MLAFRLTPALNALAMSLAAIPVYLLARRLGLGAGLALGAAALAVASPDLLFASFLLADPIAYPLVLTALYLGVRALEKPTWRAQVAFVLVAGLAAFARIQYAVLPLAFLAAALLVERGRVRRYWPTFALLALPVLAVVVLGPSRVLGYYAGVGHDHVPALAALKWAAIDTMMLAYSAGWILSPERSSGSRSRLPARAPASSGRSARWRSSSAGGVFVEAAIYAARGSTRYQERYLFALLPLVALAFGLYVKRGWPHRLVVAVVSAGDAPPLGARAALRLHRRRQQAGLAVPVRRLPARGAALGRDRDARRRDRRRDLLGARGRARGPEARRRDRARPRRRRLRARLVRVVRVRRAKPPPTSARRSCRATSPGSTAPA